MWDQQASRAVEQHLTEVHTSRASRRVDADGRALPARVDLVESGQLAASWSSEHDDRSATIRNTAPHSEAVHVRTAPLVGMTEAELDALDDVVAAELDRIERSR